MNAIEAQIESFVEHVVSAIRAEVQLNWKGQTTVSDISIPSVGKYAIVKGIETLKSRYGLQVEYDGGDYRTPASYAVKGNFERFVDKGHHAREVDDLANTWIIEIRRVVLKDYDPMMGSVIVGNIDHRATCETAATLARAKVEQQSNVEIKTLLPDKRGEGGGCKVVFRNGNFDQFINFQ